MIKLVRIVSGGQTGVDQAGLFAAEKAGYGTGGWAPHGWMTVIGPQPVLMRDRFKLVEHPGDYKARTIQNVKDSDATLVLAADFDSVGTKLTLRTVAAQKKPLFTVGLPIKASPIEALVNWIGANSIEVLNVAGNRETKSNNAFELASMVLDELFASLREYEKRA